MNRRLSPKKKAVYSKYHVPTRKSHHPAQKQSYRKPAKSPKGEKAQKQQEMHHQNHRIDRLRHRPHRLDFAAAPAQIGHVVGPRRHLKYGPIARVVKVHQQEGGMPAPHCYKYLSANHTDPLGWGGPSYRGSCWPAAPATRTPPRHSSG